MSKGMQFAEDGIRGHAIFPDEIAEQLLPLYSQDGRGLDAIVNAKFFHPMSGWTWYITEGSPQGDGEPVNGDAETVEDWMLFGVVVGHEIEYGYVSLHELATTVAAPSGLPPLPIERDCWFTPAPLREVIQESHNRRLMEWAASRRR